MRFVANDIGDSWFADGQCASFVEHDGRDVASGFEYFAIFDKNSHAGAATRADDEGGRCGDAECARTGDDEHCNGVQ